MMRHVANITPVSSLFASTRLSLQQQQLPLATATVHANILLSCTGVRAIFLNRGYTVYPVFNTIFGPQKYVHSLKKLLI